VGVFSEHSVDINTVADHSSDVIQIRSPHGADSEGSFSVEDTSGKYTNVASHTVTAKSHHCAPQFS